MIGRMRVGLIPQGSGGEARVREFVDALASALSIDVDVHQAADYRALVSAIDHELVHFAWLPPLSAARALRSGNIVPAAIAVRHGATSYLTGLITRASSGIREVSGLRGVRAAWVDRESASGYVVIRAALRQQGVSLVDAFAEDLFLRSHAEVARAVDTGRADVGATCFNVSHGSVQMARSTYNAESTDSYTGAGGQALTDIHIVAHAGPIPSDIFAVHRSVPTGLLARLQQALIGALPASLFDAAKAMMFADAFARPEPDHFKMLENLYDNVIDTRTSIAPSAYPPPRTRPPPRG